MGTGNNVRVFILLGLWIAVVALISSEVSDAKYLAEKKTEEETTKKNGLQDAKFGGFNGGGYPGNGGYQGGGGYPGNGGGYQGGGGHQGNGGGYQGGGGHQGNGGGYQGGGGHNGGGYGGRRGYGRGGGGRGGGYRCRHGCCDRGGYYRGDCYNCCYSAAQSKAFAGETTTSTSTITTADNLKP